jgi:hypothetical protein
MKLEDAKEKFCPFRDTPCVANGCMAWITVARVRKTGEDEWHEDGFCSLVKEGLE